MARYSKKYKLGLDIGSSLIKVCLPRRPGRPEVLRIPTPEGTVSKGVLQDPEGISDHLRQWMRKNQLDHYYVVATLPASTLVLRHVQLPRMKPRDLAEAIEWEARRVLPFPLEEAQLDWVVQDTVVSEEGEMQNILLVAVRDTIVERYVQAIVGAGLKVAALDISPLALGRWLLKNAQGSSLIIDIGAESTQVHFFQDVKLMFSRSFSVGGAEATRAIATAANVSFAEAEEMKLRGKYREDWLDSWYRELGREVQRSLEYYRSNFSNNAEEPFERVILSGGAAMTRGVDTFIGEVTGVEPGFAEFYSKDRRPRRDKIMYNVALGAGMWGRK